MVQIKICESLFINIVLNSIPASFEVKKQFHYNNNNNNNKSINK